MEELIDMSNFIKEIANKSGRRVKFLQSFSISHEVMNDSCCKNLCNLQMMISEYNKLDVGRNHGNPMTNILFKSHSYFYASCLESGPRNILKRSEKYWKIVEKYWNLLHASIVI